MSIKSKFGSVVLWILIGVLVVSNLAVGFVFIKANQLVDSAMLQVDAALLQVSTLQQQTTAALDAMAAELEAMKNGSFDHTVNINQEVPIVTNIPVDFVVHVPISTVVQINQTVTVPVNIPLYGQADISVPIKASIPVNTAVDVPIQQLIPVNTTVPIVLSIPISVKIADMTFAQNMTNLETILGGLSTYLKGLSIEFNLMP